MLFYYHFFQFQDGADAPLAIKGTCHKDLVDFSHHGQIKCIIEARLIVVGGFRQSQQLTLPLD